MSPRGPYTSAAGDHRSADLYPGKTVRMTTPTGLRTFSGHSNLVGGRGKGLPDAPLGDVHAEVAAHVAESGCEVVGTPGQHRRRGV